MLLQLTHRLELKTTPAWVQLSAWAGRLAWLLAGKTASSWVGKQVSLWVGRVLSWWIRRLLWRLGKA